MKKLLLRILFLGLIVWFFLPSLAIEGYGQNLKTQSRNAYEASYYPNYFVLESQNQLDSMVQFRYYGNDSAYQYKFQYKNSTNGGQTVKEEIQYQWQNGWQERVKNEYTYNSEGELMKSAAYEMDTVTNQWQQTVKNAYAFKNGKKDNNVVQKRDSISHSWKNAYKYEYSYNNSDSLTQQVLYCWNEEANEWEYDYKHEYFYNNLNCQDSSCQYQWDSVANQWARQYKYEYRYNTGNQLEKQYQFCYDSVKCQWDSCVCNLYEYDNEHLYKHEYCTFDSVNNDWDYEWKHEYFYNENGQIKQLHRYQHSSLKSTASDWILDSKDFYYYANTVMGITAQDNLVFQDLRIYPNPAQEQLTFELGAFENCRLQIIDITGRILKQYSIQSNRTVIQLNEFKPGAYFFIVDNGVSRNTSKVIIQ
ncbi:T9SS type A sorting domain-containing protein [Draconibacterium sp. IB214405]|uniref:T9SS type A sorting domain-containing protein n=1 Tax=Draconibacterium sp. IB214405 TaxID=3097352 RepID=UPI002A166519|nr:T9SS type A sorting domain-containing protein [Draconibacterium sp. IB214405]MDX8339614.1 T9SS type A sorting domain-containing protein [Draconibacterium sp. IB214405]